EPDDEGERGAAGDEERGDAHDEATPLERGGEELGVEAAQPLEDAIEATLAVVLLLLLAEAARERRHQGPRQHVGGEQRERDRQRQRREQELRRPDEEHDREENDEKDQR